MYRPFDLRLSSDLLRSSGDRLVYEIASEKDLEALEKLPLPESFLKDVRKRFAKKKPFVCHTYGPVGKSDEIHAFFPGSEESFFEEAGKLLQSLEGDIVFRAAFGSDFVKRADVLALSSYRFDAYKSDKKDRERRLVLVREDRTGSRQKEIFEERVRLLSAIRFARDLVNTPASDKPPHKIVDIVRALPWERTEVEVLDRAALEKLGFNLLLAVSSGSDEDPAVVIFRRKNPSKAAKRAIIGKGVTFDAGGLQIKPEDSMADMKSDMAGAAAVIASMWYLDAFDDLVEDVVGAVGLTENLLGGSAMKPMDIVRARNGKTVEIGHTDAEGRLVLADVVAHLAETESPETSVTVATLTGSCVSALGFDYAGMVGDDRKIMKRILEVSEEDGFEKYWELPFDSRMKEATKGKRSDYSSISDEMRAGASMGAAFIANFRGKSKFVHLDIAGPAFRTSANGVFPVDATGFGVPTLAALFRKTR